MRRRESGCLRETHDLRKRVEEKSVLRKAHGIGSAKSKATKMPTMFAEDVSPDFATFAKIQPASMFSALFAIFSRTWLSNFYDSKGSVLSRPEG
jgi:hypothetical protein